MRFHLQKIAITEPPLIRLHYRRANCHVETLTKRKSSVKEQIKMVILEKARQQLDGILNESVLDRCERVTVRALTPDEAIGAR